jgi:hypothetical protein
MELHPIAIDGEDALGEEGGRFEVGSDLFPNEPDWIEDELRSHDLIIARQDVSDCQPV